MYSMYESYYRRERGAELKEVGVVYSMYESYYRREGELKEVGVVYSI